MRTLRTFAATGLLCSAGVLGAGELGAGDPAEAAPTPVVSLSSDDADIDVDAFADDNADSDRSVDDQNWLTSGKTLAPLTKHAIEGTATTSASEASSVETPGQPPFPLTPLNDVATDIRMNLANTATGNGRAVPTTDGDNDIFAGFETTEPVPVFLSGALLVSNTDPDNCSEAEIGLDGPVSRLVVATAGKDCDFGSHPRQAGIAQTLTLPAGEYSIALESDAAMDDDVSDGDPSHMTASVAGSFNLSFFPPSAHFRHTLSGFTGHFDASSSSAGEAERPLKTWKWDFGDGHTATTHGPKVSHVFPASPRAPRNYQVTLQVVDSGGAVSPPVSVAIAGTATSVAAHAHRHRLTLSGLVSPKRPGGSVPGGRVVLRGPDSSREPRDPDLPLLSVFHPA